MGRRSGSSQRWLRRQRRDVFAAQSRAAGYRSRAALKLVEIDRQAGFLRAGMRCVDLGASPGGWSQIAAQRVGPKGRVWALDRIPMEPIPGVQFIRGDFRKAAALRELRAAVGDQGVDLVMSDMAPNISGNWAIDQPRSMDLAELALDLAGEMLKPGGDVLIKLFQGEGFDEFRRRVGGQFRRVSVKKPAASRPQSREMYLLARNYRI